MAQVDATLEANLIPYDAIWLDIEHTEGKKYFTWDGNKFPNSVEMLDKLAERNHKASCLFIHCATDQRLWKCTVVRAHTAPVLVPFCIFVFNI